MTKEEKRMLLIDLCMRLPYNTKCYNHYTEEDFTLSYVSDTDTDYPNFDYGYGDIEYIQPYLRPMSSMTEEEKIKLYQIAGFYYLSNNELLKDEWRQFSDALSENKLFQPYPIWEDDLNKVYDWLNAHHFDYRGLIEKGLALEAPEGMYNN